MEDIHFLNRHMCSPLYVSGAVIKARDTATNAARCLAVCGSQSRGGSQAAGSCCLVWLMLWRAPCRVCSQ